jgi:hypothetical protein
MSGREAAAEGGRDVGERAETADDRALEDALSGLDGRLNFGLFGNRAAALGRLPTILATHGHLIESLLGNFSDRGGAPDQSNAL